MHGYRSGISKIRFLHSSAANRSHDPKLRQIGADRVDYRSLLPDEQIARPVKHETELLFGRLRWNERMLGR